MTKHRVRVPQVADISAAIRLYYEHTEIGNKDIRAIFGDMANGSYPITIKAAYNDENGTALKQLALEAMHERGTVHYNAQYVNTEVAYDVWGIDIKRLERGIERLNKLNIEVTI